MQVNTEFIWVIQKLTIQFGHTTLRQCLTAISAKSKFPAL